MADPAAASFGSGLAARARPRVAASSHVRRSSAIGAVGRSTLGFGRIIATAGSARPSVTPDVLATRSLRPPVGAWSMFDAADAPVVEPTAWTTRAIAPAASGRTARRSPAPAPAPKPVARPRPKSDGKVDALRRLLESRGMIEPSDTDDGADSVGAAAASATAPTPPRSSGTTPGVDRSAAGDRTATSAGVDTAPGRFGRRVRPEPTAPESPLSSVFPEGVPSPTVRRSPRAAGGNDLDGFRRALEGRGMMEPSSDTAAARPATARPAATPSGRDATVRRRPRASERSTPARPRPTRDADGDTEGAPVQRGRSLPLAVAPESAPVPAPHLLRRSELDDDGNGSAPPDATLGAAIAPGAASVASVAPTDARSPDPRPNTSPPPALASDVPPANVPTSIRRSALDAVDVPSAPVAQAATASTEEFDRRDDRRVDQPVARSFDHGRSRRVELRRVAHRIGLDRTLTTSPTGPADHTIVAGTVAADRARVAPAAVVVPGAAHTQPSPTTAPPTTAPPATPPLARPTPIVVTRASEARTATRTVRHRMAGRRFVDDAIGRDAVGRDDVGRFVDPAVTVAPAARAAPTARLDRVDRVDRVAPVVTTPATASAPSSVPSASPSPSRTATAPSATSAPAARAVAPAGDTAGLRHPEPAVRRSPVVARSAVAPGPGALMRALRPAEPDRAVAPAAAPGPTAAPTVRRSPAAIAAPAAPAAPASRAPEQPDVPRRPDPAALADTIADRLGSTAPGVVTRSPAADVADRGSAPPDDLGARFLRELGREPDQSARALPAPFQPLASAVTGSARRARISSDHVSRRALDAVGKQAVTVGDTIHVVRPPRDDPRTHEVLAHELVHVAHPSPVPRFFDDDHRGPEERMAEQVARVIARSPVMPSSPVPSDRSVPPAGPNTNAGDRSIRRTADGRAAQPVRSGGAPGSIDAAALAAAIEGGRSDAPIRRAPDGSGRTLDPVGNRFDGPMYGNGSGGPGVSDGSAQHAAEQSAASGSAPVFGSGTREERDRFDELVDRTIDRIVRRVEERVIADLERRGGRYWRNL